MDGRVSDVCLDDKKNHLATPWCRRVGQSSFIFRDLGGSHARGGVCVCHGKQLVDIAADRLIDNNNSDVSGSILGVSVCWQSELRVGVTLT